MKKNIINFLVLAALIIASFSAGLSVEMITPKLNPPMVLPELTVIDGSSSTVAMHAAIRAYLTDMYLLPTHSKTYAALWRLAPKRGTIVMVDGKYYQRLDEMPTESWKAEITAKLPDGTWGQEVSVRFTDPTSPDIYPYPADLLLSVKYYDHSLAEAEKFGADLVITPIAKEGFVFMVHKDNPIESLTQEQIKGIFSGKIQNWKEVGGNDEPIITYQRNSDSGSQTAMVDFMDGVSLAATYYYNPVAVSSMRGMIIDIRANTNAIGCNIYSWSLRETLDALVAEADPSFLMSPAQIESYKTANNGIKFISVDGIMPSDESLADDSYPLRVYTYSYYNKGNEKAKTMIDWLLTEEGQKVIAGGGYVGIFGEMPPNEQIDFNRDDTNARKVITEFYEDKDYDEAHCLFLLPTEVTEKMADGKAKYLTLWGYVNCIQQLDRPPYQKSTYRFIVLTRENGVTEFEVINEGSHDELDIEWMQKVKF